MKKLISLIIVIVFLISLSICPFTIKQAKAQTYGGGLGTSVTNLFVANVASGPLVPFGNTAEGGSYTAVYANEAFGGEWTSPSIAGTVTSIEFLGAATVSADAVAIITDPSGNILTNGISNPIATTTTPGWFTASFPIGPTYIANTLYCIMIIPSASSFDLYYSASSGGTAEENSNSYSSPTSGALTSPGSNLYNLYSIYANVEENLGSVTISGTYNLLPWSTTLDQANGWNAFELSDWGTSVTFSTIATVTPSSTTEQWAASGVTSNQPYFTPGPGVTSTGPLDWNAANYYETYVRQVSNTYTANGLTGTTQTVTLTGESLGVYTNVATLSASTPSATAWTDSSLAEPVTFPATSDQSTSTLQWSIGYYSAPFYLVTGGGTYTEMYYEQVSNTFTATGLSATDFLNLTNTNLGVINPNISLSSFNTPSFSATVWTDYGQPVIFPTTSYNSGPTAQWVAVSLTSTLPGFTSATTTSTGPLTTSGYTYTEHYVNPANLGPNKNLKNANLAGFNLANFNLQGDNLQYANLAGAILTGASLQGANLQYANLVGAVLTGANFDSANLQYAHLNGATLTGTSGDYTNFNRANMEYATFTGAICAPFPYNYITASFVNVKYAVGIPLNAIPPL